MDYELTVTDSETGEVRVYRGTGPLLSPDPFLVVHGRGAEDVCLHPPEESDL